MKRNKKRVIAAVAVICALAAGGAAFTYTNTLPSSNVAGYNHMSVSGADVQSISNTLSTDGTQITAVHFVFSTAIDPTDTLAIGWSDTAGVEPTALSSTGCTIAAGGLSADCTGLTQDVENANEFAVAVSH
jgi:hypothetical protein